MSHRSKLTISGMLVFLFAIICATGCSYSSSSQLQNTRTWDIQTVDTLSVNYSTDNITFFESSTNQLIVKEYMSSSDSAYFADISQEGGTLIVKGGNRPEAGTSFSSHTEIYLPVSFEGALNVQTTSGNISMSPTYHLTSLQAQSTTGSITLGTVNASATVLQTTSGHILQNSGSGSLAATSTTGSIKIKSFTGASTIKSTSGSVTLALTALTGDVSISTTSGKISLTVPQNNDFTLNVQSTSGSVKTDYDSLMKNAVSPTPSPSTSPSVTPTVTSGTNRTAEIGLYPVHLISLVSDFGPISVKSSS